MQKSEIADTLPPLWPVKETVSAPLFLAADSPFTTFSEFPEVEIPKTTSPPPTRASTCLEKIVEKSKSFEIAVNTELSVVSANDGIAGLLTR